MPDTKNSRWQAAIDVRPLDHYQAHYSRPKAAQPGQFNSLYAKLGTHHRAETVELARALGLLAPSRTGRATARPE